MTATIKLATHELRDQLLGATTIRHVAPRQRITPFRVPAPAPEERCCPLLSHTPPGAAATGSSLETPGEPFAGLANRATAHTTELTED